MTNNNAIRNIVRKAFGEGFIDDHGTAGRIIPTAIALFVRWVDAEVSVCPLEEGVGQCLNPLYVNKKGEVHLSTCSCGGVVRARGTTLEKACEQYNKEHEFTASVVDWAQFSHITLIRREDYIKKFGL